MLPFTDNIWPEPKNVDYMAQKYKAYIKYTPRQTSFFLLESAVICTNSQGVKETHCLPPEGRSLSQSTAFFAIMLTASVKADET